MSLREIENIITEKGLTPELLPEAMMKQITWENQWIGILPTQVDLMNAAC